MNDDLLCKIVPGITVPAVRVANLVEDFLVLVHQGLKPFLEFWRRHLLPLVKATAVSTCTVALHPVIRAGTEKITVAHAILLMGNARREASELPTMAGLGRRKKVKANISAQASSRLDLRLAYVRRASAIRSAEAESG